MKLDLFTARRILRAVLAGMPAESALWVIEQALDGYDMVEVLEEVMKKALEDDQEEVKRLCRYLRPAQLAQSGIAQQLREESITEMQHEKVTFQ